MMEMTSKELRALAQELWPKVVALYKAEIDSATPDDLEMKCDVWAVRDLAPYEFPQGAFYACYLQAEEATTYGHPRATIIVYYDERPVWALAHELTHHVQDLMGEALEYDLPTQEGALDQWVAYFNDEHETQAQWVSQCLEAAFARRRIS